MSLLVVMLHTGLIYGFLVIVMSRMERSQMAALTPITYLTIALLGSSVETGLYNASGSLGAGLVSAATILMADHVTTRVLARWPRLCRPLLGTPLILVEHGRMIPAHLRRARLSEEDVRAAIRRRGYELLEDVRFAVLEIDGSIGVVPVEPP